MKQLIICTLAMIFSAEKSFSRIKGYADRKTKEYILVGNFTDHYIIYGYTLPDERSQKVIMFSTPPSVGKNRAVYKLGSYKETTNLKAGEKIKYIGTIGKFAEMNYIYRDNTVTVFYINKKFVETE